MQLKEQELQALQRQQQQQQGQQPATARCHTMENIIVFDRLPVVKADKVTGQKRMLAMRFQGDAVRGESWSHTKKPKHDCSFTS